MIAVRKIEEAVRKIEAAVQEGNNEEIKNLTIERNKGTIERNKETRTRNYKIISELEDEIRDLKRNKMALSWLTWCCNLWCSIPTLGIYSC
jgi:hypothetical protein